MAQNVNVASSRPPQYTWLNDLASEKVGCKVLYATDDWFAVAENLLKVEQPVWKEGVFTDYGKWMDGWETRRKRKPGHDWCIIQLGLSGIIHGFDVDTSYFTGNYPPKVSIQAACLEKEYPARPLRQMGMEASNEETQMVQRLLKSTDWEEIVTMTTLQPGYIATCHNYFSTAVKRRWTHIRLNYYPDGGCARLRVFGQAIPDWRMMPLYKPVDLVAIENGGICLGCSNFHYGHPRNMIGYGRSSSMADGWETARRLDRPSVLEMDSNRILKIPGVEWAVFRLGHPGRVTDIEIDTNHFKGNFPDSCRIEACLIRRSQKEDLMSDVRTAQWVTLLAPQKLSPHKRHFYRTEVQLCGVVDHIRVSIAPDGGVSRIRLHGYRENSETSKL